LQQVGARGIFNVDTVGGASMNATIQKWGNSLALRIPKAVARDTQLQSGSVVNLTVREGKMLVEPVRRTTYSLGELLKGVSKKNLHASIDTGPAVGRETW
jgi:antitoxin MazE